MTGDTRVILVAAPDPDEVAQLRSWLDDDYCVETVTNGEDALVLLEDVDVGVIDCQLRTASGSAVVEEIEQRAVTYTTAILDRVEQRSDHRLETVDWLGKPVGKAALLETVDRLLRRARYDDLMTECTALATECGTLEAGSSADLEFDENHAALERRLDEVLTELDELIGAFDGDDFQAAFATCTAGGTDGAQQAEHRF